MGHLPKRKKYLFVVHFGRKRGVKGRRMEDKSAGWWRPWSTQLKKSFCSIFQDKSFGETLIKLARLMNTWENFEVNEEKTWKCSQSFIKWDSSMSAKKLSKNDFFKNWVTSGPRHLSLQSASNQANISAPGIYKFPSFWFVVGFRVLSRVIKDASNERSAGNVAGAKRVTKSWNLGKFQRFYFLLGSFGHPGGLGGKETVKGRINCRRSQGNSAGWWNGGSDKSLSFPMGHHAGQKDQYKTSTRIFCKSGGTSSGSEDEGV